MSGSTMRVLMITSEWPAPDKPWQVPFIVRQVEYLRRANITVDVLSFRGGRNPINYFKAWLKAQKTIRGGKYDLIHAQWGQGGIPAINKPLPLVVTFRGSDVEGIVGADGRYLASGYVLSALSRLVARIADEVIVVSESLGRKLPRHDYHLIPSGIDPAVFHPMPQEEARRELNMQPGLRTVLFAGARDNPVKRFSLAQAAVDRLQQYFPVELVPLSGVAHDRVPLLMNACDALLVTSHHEGSPDVVKEAVACNLPVVSVDVGDVRERVGEIPGCQICQDDRPETVAQDLCTVLEVPRRLDAAQFVVDLDEGRLTEKVIDVYVQALSKKH